MKTSMDVRLECIRLSSMLATSKQIAPKDVVPVAMEYLKWIDGYDDLASVDDIAKIARRFAR